MFGRHTELLFRRRGHWRRAHWRVLSPRLTDTLQFSGGICPDDGWHFGQHNFNSSACSRASGAYSTSSCQSATYGWTDRSPYAGVSVCHLSGWLDAERGCIDSHCHTVDDAWQFLAGSFIRCCCYTWSTPATLQLIPTPTPFATPATAVASSTPASNAIASSSGAGASPSPSPSPTPVVPLSAVASFQPTTAPIAVNHQGQFPSVTISFNLGGGMALSDAVTAIQQMQQQIGLPGAIHGNFSGTAQAFQASLASEPFLILAALVAVYIVLGILYESYIHPITILSTLPSAGVGALLALMLFRTDLSVIAMIGLLLLIGIVKKNAILMVDFALEAERAQGMRPREAIYQACLLRFRPILMTTVAALFGALPSFFRPASAPSCAGHSA